jgi:hypothetical protein
VQAGEQDQAARVRILRESLLVSQVGVHKNCAAELRDMKARQGVLELKAMAGAAREQQLIKQFEASTLPEHMLVAESVTRTRELARDIDDTRAREKEHAAQIEAGSRREKKLATQLKASSKLERQLEDTTAYNEELAALLKKSKANECDLAARMWILRESLLRSQFEVHKDCAAKLWEMEVNEQQLTAKAKAAECVLQWQLAEGCAREGKLTRQLEETSTQEKELAAHFLETAGREKSYQYISWRLEHARRS